MASLKDVKLKISGIGKTKQITKAMNMVASSKLRGAQMRIERFRPYAEKFNDILNDLAGKTDTAAHPLLNVRDLPKQVGIILMTSERGLCGGFNINLINAALALAKSKQNEGKEVQFFCIGRKGRDAVRKRGLKILRDLSGGMEAINFNLAAKTGEDIIAEYTLGSLDEVYMIYAEFISMVRQVPRSLQLLPVQNLDAGKTGEEPGKKNSAEYIYEPDVVTLLGEILPRYIKVQIYRGLLDTSASEHAARMTAMDNATRNCDEIANALTLLFNKTRQAAITTDLIDIVSGAEALKG